MPNELELTKLNGVENQPASKGDLREAKTDIEGVDARLIQVENTVESTEMKLDALEIKVDALDMKLGRLYDSMDQRFEHLIDLVSDLPKRMTKLEKAVFKNREID